MVEFRYMRGFVYVLENPEALRVKIGMTTNDPVSRLNDVNDMWLERKVTCQICGKRTVNVMGLVPPHSVSGRQCMGGNAMPFERDTALAQSQLDLLRKRLGQMRGAERGSTSRMIKTLVKRIELYGKRRTKSGEWKIGAVFVTDCAEAVELRAHEALAERLDRDAPFGEVFRCSVPEAIQVIEVALADLRVLDLALKLK